MGSSRPSMTARSTSEKSTAATCRAEAAAGAVLEENVLETIGELLKKAVVWVLSGLLVLFTTFLTVSGAIAGHADAQAVRLAKSAVSAAVPVVGGILSDATETVLAGASAVRSTVGVAGLLAIFAIAAAPFFKIGLQYFLLKLTAALCGVVGQENHTALTESFAQAMGLLLAATGTCCLMQLLSTVCFMKGVI